MGLLARWRARRAPAPVVLDPDDPSLVVLVEAFDAARADSAVLAEAAERGVPVEAPLLLRHHLVALPDEAAVERAAQLLAQDGYALSAPRADGRGLSVHATRTQVVTALSASQERSRMAGLAQRLGGDVGGWDALAPSPEPPPAGRRPGVASRLRDDPAEGPATGVRPPSERGGPEAGWPGR